MNVVDPYLVCPFNKAHRILKSRYQQHLCKCKKSYEDVKKLQCPFDATHLLDSEEYEHHLAVCPSSGNILCYQNLFEIPEQVGTVSLQAACSVQTDMCNEDWSGDNPTYDPVVEVAKKPIMMVPIGLSKAKRKIFRRRERERIASLETSEMKNNNITNIVPKTPEFEKPLRAPKEAAKAITYNENADKEKSIHDLVNKVQDISIQKKNNSSKSGDVSMPEHNVSITKINVSTTSKNTSQCNEKENVLKIAKNISDIRENYNTGKKSYQKPLRSNSRMAAKFFGDARKISTGRGFTIAYEQLNSHVAGTNAEKVNTKNHASLYGYDED